ncbi:hypothetical protein TraAM80_04622 [Trypanosoma rangeli]|uniref:BRCT domain-containing protein n=1 Tax=Trypanosoma rangeli TaxID=5698 RepID=A0A422NIV6_TRYRA|nr:uncharacterized protein TraAM80_04622 [Trypanosoma rangeli]RNF05412.1 hypothetical protein TraAM80_04622 [Trypanosoma rangeli]|eukprot:RNF05412.1 hypothetical protein TraAM80_04622 [Trypanosoma rangeli]
MLRGHVFVAAPDVPQDVRLLIAACGGHVVASLEASVTLGLVVRGGAAKLDCAAQLRGLRIPILRSSWVRASVAAGRLLPMKHPHAEHDPALFESLRFTTTMLSGDTKERVVAAIQFFGGTYSPDLTNATDILLYGEWGRTAGNAMEKAERSLKWRCAWEWAIPRVHIAWLQECISSGKRGALLQSSATTTPTPTPPLSAAAVVTIRNGEEDENSCGSAHEAAGKRCVSFSPLRRQKRSRIEDVKFACDALEPTVPRVLVSQLCGSIFEE